MLTLKIVGDGGHTGRAYPWLPFRKLCTYDTTINDSIQTGDLVAGCGML